MSENHQNESNGEKAAPTFEIPKECKAGVVVNPGPNFRVEVQMVPVPEIKPHEVLIKLNATGICHSDVHFMAEDWDMPPMATFGTKCAGHEGAGVIVKVGDAVRELKVGMRAGFKVIPVLHVSVPAANTPPAHSRHLRRLRVLPRR